MTHFKLILHRALYTRHINPEHIRNLTTNCRLCGKTKERIEHLPNCPKLKPIWDRSLKLIARKTARPIDRTRLLLLGIANPPLPDSHSDFHLILWKFILIHFTLADLQRKPFDVDSVWKGAIRRYVSKANKLNYTYLLQQKRDEARGPSQLFEEPTNDKYTRRIAPLGKLNTMGQISWCPYINEIVMPTDAPT